MCVRQCMDAEFMCSAADLNAFGLTFGCPGGWQALLQARKCACERLLSRPTTEFITTQMIDGSTLRSYKFGSLPHTF